MPKSNMTRRVPESLQRPYPVFGPDGERLGMVRYPEQIAKLLAGDPSAGVCDSRRGYVQLGDVDSWFCLPRLFTARTYMPEAYTIICRADSGGRYIDLKSSRYCKIRVDPGHSRRPKGHAADRSSPGSPKVLSDF